MVSAKHSEATAKVAPFEHASSPSLLNPTERPSPWGKAHRLGRALRLTAVLAAIALALVLDIPLCPFAIITRHPCPGCGLTRATMSLAHGDIHQALVFHPLSLVVAPIFVLGLLYNALAYVKDGRMSATESIQGKWVTRFAILLCVAMGVVWIARFFGAFGGPVPV